MVARRTTRAAGRSGAIWGAVFGLYVAIQALSYATSYKTAASRRLLAQQFGSNAGISALVGPARSIDTVGGFTAWKCLTVLAITGSVWGLLTATKLLRGEEDAGRWELLLAGRTTRRGAGAQALVGLATGGLAMLVVAARRHRHRRTLAEGRLLERAPPPIFAIAAVAGAAMFLAVGAVTSQLCATRRQASSYAAAVLGASYALRMVADSGTGLGWLRWLTPLGWVEELQPLTAPNPVALAPIAGLVLALGVARGPHRGAEGPRRERPAGPLDRTRPPPPPRLAARPGRPLAATGARRVVPRDRRVWPAPRGHRQVRRQRHHQLSHPAARLRAPRRLGT